MELYRFELLNYVWLEGFRSYIFDEHDKPFLFSSIEEAIEELQDDFDTWAQEIKDGEREYGFDAEEFMIRCVETNACCNVELLNGKLHLVPDDRRARVPRQEYERINRTGLF